MASTGGLDSQTLDEGVEELSLSAAEGQKATFSRDELWMTFGPQTLKAEKGISDKEAVQQDLKRTATKELRKQGNPEFLCSASESSDAESQVS